MWTILVVPVKVIGNVGPGCAHAVISPQVHPLVLDRSAAGYRLGQWVGMQRRNKDSLSPERRERLEALAGWVWYPHATAWEEGYGQLTIYVQTEGHARVPATYRTAVGNRLGQWVGVQRRNKDSLFPERRERLEALPGWVWRAKT